MIDAMRVPRALRRLVRSLGFTCGGGALAGQAGPASCPGHRVAQPAGAASRHTPGWKP